MKDQQSSAEELRRYALGLLLPGISSLTVVFLTARILGAEGRGEVAFALSTANLLAILATFGLYVPVATQTGRLPREYIYALATTNFAAFAGVVGWAYYLPSGLLALPLAWSVVVGGTATSALLFTQRALQARVSSNRYVVVAASQVAVLLTATAVTLIEPSAATFLTIWATGSVALALVFARLLRHDLGVHRQKPPSLGAAIRVLVSTAPVGFALISQSVLWRSDTVVLGLVSDKGEVGAYSLAAAASSLVWLPAEAVSLMLFRSHSTGTPSLVTRLSLTRKACIYSAGIAAALSLLMVATFAAAIPALLPDFRPATMMLVVLCLGTVPAAVSRVLLSSASLLGARSALLAFSLLGLVASAAYVPAGLRAGGLGVAWVSVVLYWITLIPLMLWYRHEWRCLTASGRAQLEASHSEHPCS